jgi:hypothetical protein
MGENRPDHYGRLLFAEQRREALTRACPFCERPAGAECVNTYTGEPVRHIPAHLDRTRVAP